MGTHRGATGTTSCPRSAHQGRGAGPGRSLLGAGRDPHLKQGAQPRVTVRAAAGRDSFDRTPDDGGGACGERSRADPGLVHLQSLDPGDRAGNQLEGGLSPPSGEVHLRPEIRAHLRGPNQRPRPTRAESLPARAGSSSQLRPRAGGARSGRLRADPTTMGINGVSCWRPASLILVIDPAGQQSPSRGWVQAGWSLHRSPARNDANSMKQAPRRGVLLPAACQHRNTFGQGRGPHRDLLVRGCALRPFGSRPSPQSACPRGRDRPGAQLVIVVARIADFPGEQSISCKRAYFLYPTE